MKKAELYAEWKYPDETKDDSGFRISHKSERQAFIYGFGKAIEEYCKFTQEQIDELNQVKQLSPALDSLYIQLKKAFCDINE